jgi:hypothetical protein
MARAQIIGLVLILIGIGLFILGIAAFASNAKMPAYFTSIGKFAFMYWFIFPVLGFCLLITTPKRKKS